MCIVYKDNYLTKQWQDLVMTFRRAVNSVPEWIAIPEFPLTFESRGSCHFKRVVIIFTPQTLTLLMIMTTVSQSVWHRYTFTYNLLLHEMTKLTISNQSRKSRCLDDYCCGR
jgi:hypothetical protein